MSERELQRVELISQLDQGLTTGQTAAHVLGISRRQIQRLLKVYRLSGASALRHKARGRRSNNFTPMSKRAYALSLVKDNYADFGPTFAAEKLKDIHGAIAVKLAMSLSGCISWRCSRRGHFSQRKGYAT
ncbi:MAG: helix-turn-helix domain-containing protein [Rhodobacteraceae bacterium]|nr:helix-turn-helix domain-containing protein [Paracoccaceae bacterium]